jgi:hypothetical protein
VTWDSPTGEEEGGDVVVGVKAEGAEVGDALGLGVTTGRAEARARRAGVHQIWAWRLGELGSEMHRVWPQWQARGREEQAATWQGTSVSDYEEARTNGRVGLQLAMHGAWCASCWRLESSSVKNWWAQLVGDSLKVRKKVDNYINNSWRRRKSQIYFKNQIIPARIVKSKRPLLLAASTLCQLPKMLHTKRYLKLLSLSEDIKDRKTTFTPDDTSVHYASLRWYIFFIYGLFVKTVSSTRKPWLEQSDI